MIGYCVRRSATNCSPLSSPTIVSGVVRLELDKAVGSQAFIVTGDVSSLYLDFAAGELRCLCASACNA